MLVLDASAAFQACMPVAGFAVLASAGELVAPPLMWSETTSAIRESVWRRQISEELGQQAFDRLQVAPVSTRAPKRLRLEAWGVARERGWAKTYDAEYVALARILGCPLITIDGRLARGAAGVVEVLAPADA